MLSKVHHLFIVINSSIILDKFDMINQIKFKRLFLAVYIIQNDDALKTNYCYFVDINLKPCCFTSIN